MTASFEDGVLAFVSERHMAHFVSDMPPALYHYTSSAGMRSIASSGIIRAYNLGKMSDFVDGRYAATIMRAHIDRAYAVEVDGDALELFAALRAALSAVELGDVFVLSLTVDGDEMGMWRLYADRGKGFSFVMPTKNAHTWGLQHHRGTFLKCIYDYKILASLCDESLKKLRELFLADVAAGLKPDPAYCAAWFLDLAAWLSAAFKPEVYRDEREWRFVFRCPAEYHKVSEDGRTFVELPVFSSNPEFSCPFTAICAGPDCDYDDGILPLRRVLQQQGYGPNFPVYESRQHSVRPGKRVPTTTSVVHG